MAAVRGVSPTPSSRAIKSNRVEQKNLDAHLHNVVKAPSDFDECFDCDGLFIAPN